MQVDVEGPPEEMRLRLQPSRHAPGSEVYAVLATYLQLSTPVIIKAGFGLRRCDPDVHCVW